MFSIAYCSVKCHTQILKLKLWWYNKILTHIKWYEQTNLLCTKCMIHFYSNWSAILVICQNIINSIGFTRYCVQLFGIKMINEFEKITWKNKKRVWSGLLSEKRNVFLLTISLNSLRESRCEMSRCHFLTKLTTSYLRMIWLFFLLIQRKKKHDSVGKNDMFR